MYLDIKKFKKIILGLLVFASLLLGIVLSQSRNYLDVVALNIGEGDSILIKTPYYQNIIVDGGPGSQVINRLGENLPFYDRKINLMVLTHPDKDHVTGLVEVLKRYKVERVLYTGVLHNLPEYLAWKKIIKEKNIPCIFAQAGQTINLGKDLKIEILYPNINMNGLEIEDTNMSSIVFKMTYKNNTFLLTGDAPFEVEDKLIADGIDLKSDVLKVGHHGSKDSTSKNFLERVKPKYAVISVGKNKYGHPSLRVIRNLEKAGVKILRTDKIGDIKIRSDGDKIEIK